MKTGTKLYKLRVWLERGNTVTQRDAIQKWDYYRLSDGIFTLRTKYGMNISTKLYPNPSGDGGQYGLYKLEKDDNQ